MPAQIRRISRTGRRPAQVTERDLIADSERGEIAGYGRTDVGPMILLRGVQIVHFGSLSGDEWDIVIAA